MLVRVITLRFNPVLGSFDDTALRDFLKDKEVLSIRDHFFVKNEAPYLAVLVTYYPHRPETTAPFVAPKKHPDKSWRDLVTTEELPLFNTLRDWRAERSKRDGVPPYVVCTNQQFVVMVKTRPQSLGKLAEIEGFGKAKLEKYGQEILALLHQSPSSDTPSAPHEVGDGRAHA
jgi:ATP-dependent DNA helicase RecQ